MPLSGFTKTVHHICPLFFLIPFLGALHHFLTPYKVQWLKFHCDSVRPVVGDRIAVVFPDQEETSAGSVTELRNVLNGVRVKFDDGALWWMNLDCES